MPTRQAADPRAPYRTHPDRRLTHHHHSPAAGRGVDGADDDGDDGDDEEVVIERSLQADVGHIAGRCEWRTRAG